MGSVIRGWLSHCGRSGEIPRMSMHIKAVVHELSIELVAESGFHKKSAVAES